MELAAQHGLRHRGIAHTGGSDALLTLELLFHAIAPPDRGEARSELAVAPGAVAAGALRKFRPDIHVPKGLAWRPPASHHEQHQSQEVEVQMPASMGVPAQEPWGAAMVVQAAPQQMVPEQGMGVPQGMQQMVPQQAVIHSDAWGAQSMRANGANYGYSTQDAWHAPMGHEPMQGGLAAPQMRAPDPWQPMGQMQVGPAPMMPPQEPANVQDSWSMPWGPPEVPQQPPQQWQVQAEECKWDWEDWHTGGARPRRWRGPSSSDSDPMWGSAAWWAIGGT